MNQHPVFLEELRPYVDLFTQVDQAGRPHSFARNWQGFHVPIEVLSVADLRRALATRSDKQWST